MPNHMIGIGGLPQRAALVALLAAACLARAASQAARDPRLLLRPVARGRLGTVRTVLSQLSTKISDFSLEYRDLEGGHSADFDSAIRRFDPSRLSQKIL
jgi:hypothetical protein